MTGIIDITRPLTAQTPPWPGRPGLKMETTQEDAGGILVTNTALTFDAHLGTHFDVPGHVGEPRGEMAPLSALMGPCTVIDTRADVIGADDLVGPIRERVLVRTDAPFRPGSPDAPGLDEGAADALVAAGCRLVGIDQSSVQSRSASARTHTALLDAGVAILEGLDLSRAAPGDYDLVALPLHIPGCDGLPARAILLPPGSLEVPS